MVVIGSQPHELLLMVVGLPYFWSLPGMGVS